MTITIFKKRKALFSILKIITTIILYIIKIVIITIILIKKII